MPTPEQEKDPKWREKNELMHQSLERTKAMDDYVADKRLAPACPTPWLDVIATGSKKVFCQVLVRGRCA